MKGSVVVSLLRHSHPDLSKNHVGIFKISQESRRSTMKISPLSNINEAPLLGHIPFWRILFILFFVMITLPACEFNHGI
jgi:hypothetical protein